LSGDDARYGDEGYSLTVAPKNITIEAAASAGAFYGVQTLRQLLPMEIFSPNKVERTEWSIPCIEIFDKPRFKWRGMMLDSSRHFFAPAYVKRYLDNIALHKINVFHWHLTDDQGWRIEIKKYPKLTELGAWRGDGAILPMLKYDKDSSKYGGFYTQKELKDIVAYAAKLHIDILPEVDVPGHSRAITASYPETLPSDLINADKEKRIDANVISPAREENYKMMEEIFGELAEIFPFPYIHVGGDEVRRDLWSHSPKIKAFMKSEHIANTGQLQGYFTRRLEKIVAGYGKTLIGWNEIMGGKVGKDTIIMSWTSSAPGIRAARNGYNVVMTPGRYTYFDMKYPGRGETGHWWAGVVSTEQTYSYNPLPNILTPEQQAKILGVQACLWSSFLSTEAEADYKTYPRLCALSEVAWSPRDKRSWDDFNKRLATHLKRLGILGINYHLAIPKVFAKSGEVRIVPPNPEAIVRYTVDKRTPTKTSPAWEGVPLKIRNVRFLRTKAFFDGKESKVVTGAQRVHFASWSKESVSDKYQTLEFDVTGEIIAAGTWQLELWARKGKQKPMARNARLFADGKEIASDTHEAAIINKKGDRIYKLDVENFRKGAKYTLKIDMKGDGGNDTTGIMLLDRISSEK